MLIVCFNIFNKHKLAQFNKYLENNKHFKNLLKTSNNLNNHILWIEFIKVIKLLIKHLLKKTLFSLIQI